MKFFSNDPKENPDDRDRGSDVVTSEPVAVPQQRAGSPWSDSPDTQFSDRDTTTTYGPDETVTETNRDEDAARDDSAAGDASSAAAPQDETTAPQDETGAPQDEGETVRDETAGDDPFQDDTVKDEPFQDDTAKDLRDDTSEGAADHAADGTARDDAARDDAALKDDGTFDGPTAVDPATGDDLGKSDVDVPAPVDPTTGGSLDNAEPGLTEPVVAVVPENAVTPGSVPAPGVDRLFADGDSFAERFREIQLTFVDSPKEATAQAAALVTEAVEAVTASLNEKRNALAAGSEDTEQLRVELRGYRDLLKRISEL